jgi:hypothetical protein
MHHACLIPTLLPGPSPTPSQACALIAADMVPANNGIAATLEHLQMRRGWWSAAHCCAWPAGRHYRGKSRAAGGGPTGGAVAGELAYAGRRPFVSWCFTHGIIRAWYRYCSGSRSAKAILSHNPAPCVRLLAKTGRPCVPFLHRGKPHSSTCTARPERRAAKHQDTSRWPCQLSHP